jgi:hypothetical protein
VPRTVPWLRRGWCQQRAERFRDRVLIVRREAAQSATDEAVIEGEELEAHDRLVRKARGDEVADGPTIGT